MDNRRKGQDRGRHQDSAKECGRKVDHLSPGTMVEVYAVVVCVEDKGEHRGDHDGPSHALHAIARAEHNERNADAFFHQLDPEELA